MVPKWLQKIPHKNKKLIQYILNNLIYYSLCPSTIKFNKFLIQPGKICESIYILIDGGLDVSFTIND